MNKIIDKKITEIGIKFKKPDDNEKIIREKKN